MNKKLRYFLFAIIGLGLLLIIGATLFFNAPKASVASISADYTLSSTELFQEYNENQSVADQKFINKVIEVSGTIFEKSTDQQGATVFILNADENAGGVLCTMTLDDTPKVANKNVGDPITLKGQCSGMLMEVVLNRCTLVD